MQCPLPLSLAPTTCWNRVEFQCNVAIEADSQVALMSMPVKVPLKFWPSQLLRGSAYQKSEFHCFICPKNAHSISGFLKPGSSTVLPFWKSEETSESMYIVPTGPDCSPISGQLKSSGIRVPHGFPLVGYRAANKHGSQCRKFVSPMGIENPGLSSYQMKQTRLAAITGKSGYPFYIAL